MFYDLRTQYGIGRAKAKLEALLESRKMIELKEKRKKRTISQNKYMYVLFTLFGIETGYTKNEVKELLKKECADIFRYEKNGSHFHRSTSDLNKDECIVFIDWIIKFAGEQGIHLPTSLEYLTDQHAIDIEIDLNRGFQLNVDK
jgi:hypothetical protein